MLSITDYNDKGIPIAQIKGGKYNNQVIFINVDSTRGNNKIKTVNESHLVPFPSTKERQILYVAGASGSGKSTYASQYIYNYLNIFPDNKVYVFSRLEIDPILESLGCISVPLNEELEQVDIIKDIDNALCLFDDIDTIPDKKLRELVYKIQNDILETGRHNNIYVIITSHLLNGNDRKNCRTILNESQQITFFPKGGNAHSIIYLLKNYIGLSKNQTDDILKLKTRWVTLCKNYPQVVFYEHGAYTL